MSTFHVHRVMRPLAKELLAAGCILRRSGRGGHVRVELEGRLVGTMSVSPSNRFAALHARADFKKRGIIQ